MATAPNVRNYAISRGTFAFTPEGGSSTVLGNVRDCVYTPDITKKDHFSTQVGIRTKDLSVVSQLGANMKMTLDELTDFNLALYLLGDLSTSGGIGALTNHHCWNAGDDRDQYHRANARVYRDGIADPGRRLDVGAGW